MLCTQDINTQNAERAKLEHPGVGFGEITVTITSVNRTENRIQFTTRGADDQDHSFTCSLSDVWLDCPSTAQQAGDHGTLKISAAGLTGAKSDLDGTTPIKNAFLVDPKWPDRAAGEDLLTALEIWPIDVIVEGYAQGDPEKRARISLLDGKLCGPVQNLRFDAASKLTLSLTEAGLAEFGLLVEDSLPELAWAVEELRKPVPMARSLGLRNVRATSSTRAAGVIERWRQRADKGQLPEDKLAAVRELLKLAA